MLDYLADRVEGNLLAAHQELQKLALLAPEGELGFETVREAVADVARSDTNAAAEALLKGDTERYLRVLEGLRGEGEAPIFLLFTISSALFALSAPGGWVSKALQRMLSPPPAPTAPRRWRAPSRTPPRSTARSRASARAKNPGRIRQARPRAAPPRRAPA